MTETLTPRATGQTVRRARRLAALALILALLALLAAGALRAQQRYLMRGVGDEFPEPNSQGGPTLGMNVYLEHYDAKYVPTVLADIRSLGVSTVKQTFHFTESFDWDNTDRLMSAIDRAGLAVVPLLDGNPADGFAPPADPTSYADWAAEFARRYGDQVSAYMIWDEPNITSHWGGKPANPAEYAALLVAAAAAIRATDPDAVIVAAPLAPTVETGPQNLAEPLFLQGLYEAGAADAFDVVAAKPYGFDSGPFDRDVSPERLNFSRAILLRETMLAWGDGGKAIWAGNWGWNSLPAGWSGGPSIWGQTSEEQRAAWVTEALDRARTEWPWMGLMFLESWEPNAPEDDPRWGFAVAGTATADALRDYQLRIPADVAYPGFHLAQPDDPSQTYAGGWRFSPEFGADISQSGDRVTMTFWGTSVGLRVRRADFRARLYATVDGLPANALPRDENGTALVLTSADPADDMIVIEPIASGLTPGRHTLEIVASRGWDQWALNGFSVGYRPTTTGYQAALVGLGLFAAAMLALSLHFARRAALGEAWRGATTHLSGINERGQLLLTALSGAIITLTGWLTWNGQAESIYRRLGDGGQLAATAIAASLFYVTPVFFVYAAALLALFALLVFRPVWGLVLIAFVIPFYVPPLPKAIFDYRFSPVEVFTLLTAAATVANLTIAWARQRATRANRTVPLLPRWNTADSAVLLFAIVATVSLAFTERLGVALDEWRVVVVEPALFYALIRAIRPSRREMSLVLGAFVLSGLVIALIGLGQYITGVGLITAEGGLMRLRSIYGSPNNVGLYLGRIIPLLAALLLFTWGKASGRQRAAMLGASLPIAAAVLLSFSKGALLLGIPAGLAIVFWLWQSHHGRRAWPWLVGFALTGIVAVAAAAQVPALSARLNLFGVTGVFRLNLWQSAFNMVLDHPLFGVGLDNFLYAYRGRYILDAAWQEPNLNHPHNILLDFASRLGIIGLLAGGWMFFEAGRFLRRAWRTQSALMPTSLPWLAVSAGFCGTLADVVAHGLVDHSFFLIDLAYVFFLMLGAAVWLSLPSEGD